MSLFLPSNLSPNFEEIVSNGASDGVNIDFEFQVNTNGSCVRSYKLEILNDKNDADVPEDNILATFYGMFDPPLYNKDIHTINLSEDVIKQQVILEVPKDYRWRIRLYEDEILPQKEVEMSQGKITEITPDQFNDIYYDKHWTSKLTFIFDSKAIPDKITYKLNNDDEDTWQEYYSSNFIDNTFVIELPHDNNWGSIEVSTYNEDAESYIGYQDQYRILYYSADINIQTVYGNTYVGAGYTVGTTKNVVWLNESNDNIVEEKFIQTTLRSDDPTNDFNPFNQEEQCGTCKIIKSKSDPNTKITEFQIDLNDILPEYCKKIADGNMYIMLDYENLSDVPSYDTNKLPKLITGFRNNETNTLQTNCLITIDERQAYIDYTGKIFSSDTPYSYSLVYIQRQQIYSVDNSIGTHQLTKITLDEPLDYNTFHNTKIETGLVSDDFDYGRVYIDPVKEFDSKLVPSAYINIAYSDDQVIYTGASGSYVVLSEEPTGWDTDYEKYFETLNSGEYVPVKKQYSQLEQKPDNWETSYIQYYECDPTTKKYSSLSSYAEAPTYAAGSFYKYAAPTFKSDKYYSYGISQIVFSNHANSSLSLACLTLTNYVSKTGECSLFSDLKFKPDRHYMYQIFVVDQEAPNYDAASSTNPYKFYAGTTKGDTGVSKRYYLGGYNGNLTQSFDERDNLLQIYSNHRIDETNQFLCFIQPNNGIYEDKYKPCMLQLYNNKYQHDLYITNYNGTDEYNKNYSIDTLDDSQWLVALTYANDDYNQTIIQNNLISLIQKPQTKYKIYTNFVNSIPEAYFYYRSSKTLEFEYRNLYTKDKLTCGDYNGITVIPQRDVCVKCKIYDSNDPSHKKNLVPIKYYKYIVAEADINDPDFVGNIIYESDLLYDGKFEYVIKGLNNAKDSNGDFISDPQLYRIQITAEDEYGRQYPYAKDVYFGYSQDIVNDRISAAVDCYNQAIHIDFSPVKIFSGEGKIKNNENNSVEIVDELKFESLQDTSGNIISIPSDFVFYTKLKIEDSMFDIEDEQEILTIEDDSGNLYTVKFDTRVYIKPGEEKTQINSNYLSFKLYKNKNKNSTPSVIISTTDKTNYPDSFYEELCTPNKFEYMINTEEEKTELGIYMIEESQDKLSVSTNQFNINNALISPNNYLDYLVGIEKDDTLMYHIYDNDGSDINNLNKGKIGFLYFKIESGDSPTMTISQTNIE